MRSPLMLRSFFPARLFVSANRRGSPGEAIRLTAAILHGRTATSQTLRARRFIVRPVQDEEIFYRRPCAEPCSLASDTPPAARDAFRYISHNRRVLRRPQRPQLSHAARLRM